MQQLVDFQGELDLQQLLGVLEVRAENLLDLVDSINERVAMDEQSFRCFAHVLIMRKIALKRRHEAGAKSKIVLMDFPQSF